MSNSLYRPGTIRRIHWTGLLLLVVCHAAAPAQLADIPESDTGTTATSEPSPAQIALAEGIYTQEYLGDLRQSIELYRRALTGAGLAPQERALARFRLARCFRAIDRPEPARRLLLELLREPSLGIGIRESSEHELRGLPVPQAVRLMPADTLVYLDTADFTELLERFTELARLSGELVPPTIPRDQADLLRNVVSVGIGWHGFRSDPRTLPGASDTVFLAFTDGSDEVADALESLARQWIGPARLERIENAPPSTAFRKAIPGRFWYASDHDLFVICTDPYAGARAIGLHRGEFFAVENPASQTLRTLPVATGASARIYIDWRGLRSAATGDSADPPADDDGEFWNDFVVSSGSLRLQDGALLLDIATTLQSGPRSLYPVVRSGPRRTDWPRWLPNDASFSLVSSFTDGANRWHEFVSRVLAAPGDAEPQWLRSLETTLTLSVADEVFEPIRDVAVFRPVRTEASAEARSSPWILAIHVTDASAWMATVYRCLRQLLLGSLEEADLPISTMATPAGVVRVLSPTRGLTGISWLVRDGEVLLAPSPDVLVEFLSRESTPPRPLMHATEERESKQIVLNLADWTRNRSAARSQRHAQRVAPMVVRTYEREDMVRIRLEQPQAHAVIPIYLEWLRDALKPTESRGTQ